MECVCWEMIIHCLSKEIFLFELLLRYVFSLSLAAFKGSCINMMQALSIKSIGFASLMTDGKDMDWFVVLDVCDESFECAFFTA